MTTTRFDEKAEELSELMRAELGEIELDVVANTTLADLMRAGARVTIQAYNWGNGETACALSAAGIGYRAYGLDK